jgi:hypothetical protein
LNHLLIHLLIIALPKKNRRNMGFNYRSSMMIAFVAVLLAALVQDTDAFVKGSATTRTRPSFATTERYAVAKKKAAPKKAAKASAKAGKVALESCRKPEIISQLMVKLDMSKVDADAALAAVLGTIQEVSSFFRMRCLHSIVCDPLFSLLSIDHLIFILYHSECGG